MEKRTVNTSADAIHELRRLRKKLRQIENLELLGRSLNDEEKLKIASKNEIRDELQRMLSSMPEQSCRTVQDSIPTADVEEDEDGEESDANSKLVVPSSNNDTLKRQLEDVRIPESAPSTASALKRLKSNKDSSKTTTERDDQHTTSAGNLHEPYRQTLKKLWRTSEFTVRELIGHSDTVTAVAADGNIIVSASMDTTVKVWNSDTGQETFSLRGHTSSVTCLVLPSKGDSDELCRYLGLADRHRVALTGSTDCSVILWSLTSGKMVKSIYTFNTITCLVYVASEICIVTATDGGKIEIWDAIAGTSLRGLTMFDESYTCMKAVGSHIYAASSDGIIKVWEICDRDLISRFTLEELGSGAEEDDDDGGGGCGGTLGADFIVRRVRCLDARQDWVFYGDDGVNLKAFNWKTRQMKKYTNHTCESGSTDSVFCTDREIVSTSYDLDSGRGHLNVRLFPEGDYLCSLMDDDTTRINCVACTATTKVNFRIVTGGAQLKLWEIAHLPRNTKRSSGMRADVFKPTYVESYARQATNSEYESSGCETDYSIGDDRYERIYIPKDVSQRSSFGWSFCTIL